MERDKAEFFFKIEGQQFKWQQKIATAKQLIELAKNKNLQMAEPPINDLVLKGGTKIYSGNEEVDLSKDNDFSLGPRVYRFEVNGYKIESKNNMLSAEEIIKLAEKKGTILPKGEIKNLLLATIGEPKQKFLLTDKVDFNQFHKFVIILNDPTPVA